jgi:hypothetical protein
MKAKLDAVRVVVSTPVKVAIVLPPSKILLPVRAKSANLTPPVKPITSVPTWKSKTVFVPAGASPTYMINGALLRSSPTIKATFGYEGIDSPTIQTFDLRRLCCIERKAFHEVLLQLLLLGLVLNFQTQHVLP